MSFVSFGDLAKTHVLQRQTAGLKTHLDRLTKEVSSGGAPDITRHLSGRLTGLADVEHTLRTLQGYSATISEAQAETGVMQTELGRVQTGMSDLATQALSTHTTNGPARTSLIATTARDTLAGMVAALNADIGGRAVFAGDDISGPPLVPAEAVLSELRMAVSGAADAAGVITALDTFFDTAGSDFETLVYQGGTGPLAPYQLGPDERIALDLKADDPALRPTFRNVAMAAILDDPGLPLTQDERADLARQAGEGLLAAQTPVSDIRATLGIAEERIETAQARVSTELSALGIVKNDLTTIDPFESATELDAVQTRLETLYTITARTSRLTLANFLS